MLSPAKPQAQEQLHSHQPRLTSISPAKSGGGLLESEQNIMAASNAIYKEAATKVVDLQRQVISLRSKLKHKEAMESENDRLKRELNDYKAKYLESQKRNFALQEENRALAQTL